MIVVGICVLLLFLGLAALNAFRLSFLNPTTPGEIVLFTSISLIAFLLFLAALLLLMRNALKLYAEQRSRVLGARLRTRMLWGAVLLSLLPITCMFSFSYLLMNRAVERWFSQPAEQLRDESSRVATDLSRYVAANARSEAEELAGAAVDGKGDLVTEKSLGDLMRDHDITLQGGFVMVFREGKLLATHHAPVDAPATLSSWRPQNAGDLDEVPASTGSPLHVQAIGSLQNMVSQAVRRDDQPILSSGGLDYVISSATVKPGVIVVAGLPLPEGMTAHIAELDRAGQQYWTLFRLRRQIRGTYMLLMLMITSLALFVASWLALHLSKQVTKPVEALAEAMASIARGNYDQRVEKSATEELGDLVQSFNTMAEDLESSRRLLEQRSVQLFEANVELEARRHELETMLQTIPNGVVMLDAGRRIRVVNRAFSEMLDPGGQRAFLSHQLEEVLPAEAMENIGRLLRRSHRMGTASAELEMPSPSGTLNIAATAAVLETANAGVRTVSGYVLVLENATQLLHAQKQSAWKEVARRVAHEIKNPLTPIALSAEQIRRHIVRLGELLHDRDVDAPSVATIHRCSEVISSSVDSMRSLVDQFSSLAEFPSARPRPADLNGIVDNTLSLFAGRLQGIAVVETLAPGLPLVMADPEAIKRALSNLIDNAAEAMHDSLHREIYIETRPSEQSPGMLELVVADTGPGVTDQMRENLFLPYFSTKQRGTGLGLTIAAKIMADHQGSIHAEANSPKGARFILELPIASATGFEAGSSSSGETAAATPASQSEFVDAASRSEG
jgi:nitrogen fixation/metabolism regulation signal transduction histidine kinase